MKHSRISLALLALLVTGLPTRASANPTELLGFGSRMRGERM